MFYSVIVPVFNRRKYIKRCLDSIIAQTFSDFEIIVVDDGSGDGTGAVCDEYMKNYMNVRVFHQKNRGVSKARNVGLKMAEGEFALFVDSDDYLLPDYLEQLRQAYEKYGNAYWYFTSFKVYTGDGVQYFRYRKGVVYSKVKSDGLVELINKGLFNSVVNKIYEMALVRQYKICFPEDISLGEDLIFNMRYLDKLKEFRFFVLNKNLYICSWIDDKQSLERNWRMDYFEIQKKLLRIKKKYVNKWLMEKKISVFRRNVFDDWNFNFIRGCTGYYIVHIKEAGLANLVSIIINMTRSEEYLEYVQMHGNRKGILTQTIYHIIKNKRGRKYGQ